MSIAQKGKELVEEFSLFDNWMDKYEHIIELGKNLPLIEQQHKVDENVIRGCQSTVWLYAEKHNSVVKFAADADALIAKGIVALLIRVMSDEKPEDIMNASLDFIGEIGLQEHLSPTRANGLASMVKQMKLYALGFSKAT